MEKFSSFRDPATGIQPFLTLVPPPERDWIVTLAYPLGYILGVIRTICVLSLGLIYVLLVHGLCLALTPVPILYRLVSGVIVSVIARSILLLAGVVWLPVETVSRKRGKLSKHFEAWHPKSGDIIISNWVSWIEILWLAFRFNPIFVVPVPQSYVPSPSDSTPKRRTGRQTGTGSADIASTNQTLRRTIPISGFCQVSLLSAISATGRVPPFRDGQPSESFESILKRADRPVVVFPECTTSNGRGLLRFASVFGNMRVPVNGRSVFVMCVRFDPPSMLSPTTTHSIPSGLINPLGHLFNLTTALQPLSVSIRLLAPSDSPSSPLFTVSEIAPGHVEGDQLSEVSAALIAQMGRMKRTGMGWEDKAQLLELVRSKSKS